MNTKDHFCSSRHLLLVIALYPRQQNWKCLHIRNHPYTEFHISNFWRRRSLGRKPRYFSPLGFDTKPKKSSSAFKRCLNEKNLIHGRVVATISKFSPQIFETYFSYSSHVCYGELFCNDFFSYHTIKSLVHNCLKINNF